MPRKKDGMPFEVHPTPAKGREITDPDDVKSRDICFNGVDYQPGPHLLIGP